jgi:hypothetical protein
MDLDPIPALMSLSSSRKSYKERKEAQLICSRHQQLIDFIGTCKDLCLRLLWRQREDFPEALETNVGSERRDPWVLGDSHILQLHKSDELFKSVFGLAHG